MSGTEPPLTGENRPDESLFSQRSGILDPLCRYGSDAQPSSWGQRPDTDLGAVMDTDGFAGDGNYGAGVDLDDPADMEDQIYRNDEEMLEIYETQHRAREHQKMLRLRRRRKKQQVLFNRFRFVLKLLFAGGMVFGLWQLLQAPFWRFDQPRFRLENNHLLTRTQILPFLGPYLGKPLPQVDVGRITIQIQKKYPIVDYVAIRRELFPARLNVIVREKMPWAQISSGTVLPHSAKSVQKKEELKTLPEAVVSTAPLPQPVLEKPYGLLTEKGAISLASSAHLAPYSPKIYPKRRIEVLILQPSTRYRRAYINSLRQFIWKAHQLRGLHLQWTDARQPEHVTFHFHETNVVLGRLNDSAEQRLLRILTIMPKLKELKDVVDGVDLQWEEQVTLHTRSNVHLQAPERPKTDG
jgi:hypothetical protein